MGALSLRDAGRVWASREDGGNAVEHASVGNIGGRGGHKEDDKGGARARQFIRSGYAA
jgi:hypothetical protein